VVDDTELAVLGADYWGIRFDLIWVNLGKHLCKRRAAS
jgi:hypothetical protein